MAAESPPWTRHLWSNAWPTAARADLESYLAATDWMAAPRLARPTLHDAGSTHTRPHTKETQ